VSAQPISADGPGTILRDIETLIEFIGERGVATKSKQGNLPAAALPAISGRLRRIVTVHFLFALICVHSRLR